ncbi:MAG: non-hydrolyzing UDP-N-acetylglucosamine 2-epimerase [Candidatus Limnocylindria bacterium]
MKVVSVVGARPQFVKAAPVSRRLREDHREVLVHTGQHYDDAMSTVFFRDLDLPPPDRDLGVGSGTHAVQTAEMLRQLEPVLIEEAPDVVLVYGDTNSTLAGALAAAKLLDAGGRRPWLAHVEAGLRSFNASMPEERNRIVADHLADLALAPTPAAMVNLTNEGLAGRAVMVGDVMVDAFLAASSRADDHLPPAAKSQPYLLMTLHRPSNVDDPARLGAWIEAVADYAGPVLFPVHPRTRAVLDQGSVRVPRSVTLLEPQGYLAMVALERAAHVIATDSGGVQKEAYLAGVPCVTLRSESEWVETLASGWNRLCPEPGEASATIAAAAAVDRSAARPALFGDGHAADRIVAALEHLTAGRDAALVAS